ncbi:MAG: FKBP-type peptidyl-prolyl cis-trans isomerase [Bacteroidia bacterium]|nr:FKBP-type peptidyl-prolyl cis-trans isomerase [Bacteroidia bacterium]
MKQTRIKNLLLSFILLLLIGFSSCRNDDDSITSIPERDRTEQQIVDRDSLQGYLQTHYYNSADFAASMNPTIDDLLITELESGEMLPDGHTLLIDAIETHTTVFLEVDYEYYILRLNQGGGDTSPKFSDQIRVNYKGYLQDGSLFDSSANSVVFDMSILVPGWSRAVPQFNNAENFVLNGDGTVTFNNAGVGVMFLPSGLGYYSGGAASILPYSNLLFAFDLFQSQVNDHDNDGIPSYVEDLNADIDLSNDDTDGNSLANFVDPDDDGDGVLTRNELESIEYIVDTNMGEEEPILADGEYEIDRSEEDGIITINTVKTVDSNSDGTPDYLDDTIDIDYSEES